MNKNLTKVSQFRNPIIMTNSKVDGIDTIKDFVTQEEGFFKHVELMPFIQMLIHHAKN